MQAYSQAESLRPRVALLADRDPDTRAMYAEFLNYLGWATLEAANGRDALATVVGQHPAVVILETHLAFIDGLELCRLIRREGEPRPAIVVLTGDVYPAHLEEAQRAGADVVLTKPCLPERLAAELQEVLESSHALRARPGVLTEKAD